jgi:hypothetical protein
LDSRGSRSRLRFTAGLAAIAVVVAACSAGATGSSGPATSAASSPSQDAATEETIAPRPQGDAEDLAADAAVTAEYLAEPDRAESGVWSLLANLGIGVYAPDGTQILAGSETGPDDFFLNDFQVEWLVGLSQQPDQPFADLHLFLTQFGAPFSEDEMLAIYRDAYEENASEWLPSFVMASGVDLSAPPRLNPLVMWVMALDAFPPNGEEQNAVEARLPSPDQPNAATALFRHGAVVGQEAQSTDPCKMIVEARAKSGWGWASKVRGFYKAISESIDDASKGAAPAKQILDPKDLLHALMMHALVDIQLGITADIVHERHAGGLWLNTADEIGMQVIAEFVWDLPETDRCLIDLLKGFNIPPKGGKGLEGVRVEWTFSPLFGEHGSFRVEDGDEDKSYAVNFLDEVGSQTIIYRSPAEKAGSVRGEEATGYAANEPGGSNPGFHSEDGQEIEARLYLHLADLFNVFGAFMDLITPRTVTETVMIQWHEPTLQIRGEQPLDGWDGTANVGLQTCDGTAWQGTMTVDGTLSTEGGVVTMTGEGNISLNLAEGANQATAPFTYQQHVAMNAGDGTANHDGTASGSVTMDLDHAAGTGTVTIDLDPTTANIQVSAAGRTITMQAPVQGGSSAFTVPLETATSCGS